MAFVNIQSKDLALSVYEPTHGWASLRLEDLWHYRELLYFLTWRDIKIRYKQTALGVAWVVLQPLITMLIFSVIFGRLAKLPSDGVPYPVFSYAALLPWGLFSGALQRAGTSLVSNANLITKVYFPRLVIPVSAVAAGLVDFVISFAVLLGLMLCYKIMPTWMIFTIPLFVLSGDIDDPGCKSVAFGAQCAVPRCSIHDPLPDPGLDVRLAGGLFGRFDSLGTVAHYLWP